MHYLLTLLLHDLTFIVGCTDTALLTDTPLLSFGTMKKQFFTYIVSYLLLDDHYLLFLHFSLAVVIIFLSHCKLLLLNRSGILIHLLFLIWNPPVMVHFGEPELQLSPYQSLLRMGKRDLSLRKTKLSLSVQSSLVCAELRQTLMGVTKKIFEEDHYNIQRECILPQASL
ncbi:hypothetical protein FGO68_gene2645 [Halteria grandinella]|uniref:Uncharacterized protein n=1 Tax=Halteria grandinella TaxID=5974 RepID=A0A8J8NKB4_HALGN|nr:hypothetical protein FGO68_gene2645 [Halteria grandinella]